VEYSSVSTRHRGVRRGSQTFRGLRSPLLNCRKLYGYRTIYCKIMGAGEADGSLLSLAGKERSSNVTSRDRTIARFTESQSR
jgi:hypothetical protein